MAIAKPGQYRIFFEDHCRYNEIKDIDALAAHYVDDAALLSTDAQFYGSAGIKTFFTTMFSTGGDVKVLSIDKFVETPDSILAQTTLAFETGEARMFENMLLKDGLIYRHYFGQLSFTPKA